MLIFTELMPAQQPFVNNPYSEFHENLPNGLSAHMWSVADGQAG
jgi:hypothetical protein